jgi:alkanesulfonate monooxygenase SsuD/methylene tetrahydromethanopterin reductase-like flavin-dependent oxidoreductase (luciferase family)
MLASEIAMLDQLLKGRRFKFGVGRGISPDEYAALGVPQSESRERFSETLDILAAALTKTRFSYDGDFFKVPEMSIRPEPLHDDLMKDVLCGFNTPESMNLAAARGLGQLFIPASPIEEMRARVISYNNIRAERGLGPDQPTNYLWCYCVEKEEDAIKGVNYFRRFKEETSFHYGFGNSEKFAKIKGYEAYADTSKTLGWGGWERENPFEDPYLANQAIGTPDQILERVERLQKATGAKEVVVTWAYGGMPHEESLTSMKLFAKEVLPTLQRMETPLMDPNWGPQTAPAEIAAE